MTESLTLTAIEAAAIVGVHRQTFTRWAAEAGLVPVSGGGRQRKRWSRADVERMTRPEEQSRRCTVYRCYDAERTLLYVGSTGNLPSRRAQHAAYSPWLELVTYDEAQWYASERAARVEEQVTIQSERPLFNRQFATPETDACARAYLLRIGRADLIESCVEARR